eukprot:symbB.v1.2.002801.t1/scaffold91.1/size338584/6
MDECRPVRGADRLQIFDSRHDQRRSASGHADEPCSAQQFRHCGLPLHLADILLPVECLRPHRHATIVPCRDEGYFNG